MKGVFLHAALAVGGLVLAYQVWAGRDEPEVAAEAVTVIDCQPRNVSALALFDESRRKRTRLDVEAGGDDPLYRFTVTRFEKAGGSDGDADGADPATDEGQAEDDAQADDDATAGEAQADDEAADADDDGQLVPASGPPKRFLGAPSVEEYLDEVAPFRAIRSLGAPDDALLEEIDLADPESTFTYVCGDDETVFDLGGTAFGSGDRYVRPRGKDTVYLVSADVFRDFESAEFRMIQREYQDFDWTEVAALTVTAGGKTQRLLQRNRLDPEQAQWVDADDPDRRNELFGNWMNRVKRLRVQDYLAPDTGPGDDLDDDAGAGAPVDVATVIYLDEAGQELGRIALARVESDSDTWFYGKSDVTRGWTTLSRPTGVQVEDDARLILGLDPVERPEDRVPESAPEDGEAGAAAEADGESSPSDGDGTTPTPTGAPQPPPGHPPVGASDG